MEQMAREVVRVGRAGWIQTPAWEFPIEPHFHLPFMHWLGKPLSARLLPFSPLPAFRNASLQESRFHVEHVNLVSKREFKTLFPNLDIYVERFVFAKSYAARWMPEGCAGENKMPSSAIRAPF
jgi:hypothetical protein